VRKGGRARGEACCGDGDHRPDSGAFEGPGGRRDTRDGHEAGVGCDNDSSRVDSDDRSGRVDPGDCSSRAGSDSHSSHVGPDDRSSHVGPDSDSSRAGSGSDSSRVGPRTRQAIANHGVAVRANP